MPKSKGKTVSVPLVGNHTEVAATSPKSQSKFYHNHRSWMWLFNQTPCDRILWGSSSGFIFSAIANKKTVTYHQIQKAQKTWLSIANTTTFPFQLASEGKAGLQKGAPEISSS